MANVSIPLGEIAPAGNNFLAYLAKIIPISQYAQRSTDTFLVHLCATRVDELWITDKGEILKRDTCHEYFPSLIKFTQMANVSIPLGEIAPAGNNFLAYLAKIITISQYASLSTDTFLVQLCAR